MVTTTGRTRYSTAAEEGSVLKVYDSVIWSHGIPFGEGIPAPDVLMSTPPPPLEIDGNTRTHCTMSNSQSFFYRSKIICDGWAALSTESSEGYVYLEANDCDIVCTKNGYGAYADPGCHDVFNRCNLEMARMAAILAGNCDMTFTDCTADCGSYFALMHCVNGWQEEVGSIEVNGGYIRSKKEAFLIKSDNVEIRLNGVDIASERGVLVHTIINDDPCATKVTEPPYGVNVRLTDMTVSGDLLHEDTTRDMWVELRSTVLTGAIRGAHLTMDPGSKWIAAANGLATINEALRVGEHAANDPAVTGNYMLFWISLFAVRCACMCLQMAGFQLAASWFVRLRGRVLGIVTLTLFRPARWPARLKAWAVWRARVPWLCGSIRRCPG